MRRLHQHARRREVREPLGEVDPAVLGADPRHLANDRLGEALNALGDHACARSFGGKVPQAGHVGSGRTVIARISATAPSYSEETPDGGAGQAETELERLHRLEAADDPRDGPARCPPPRRWARSPPAAPGGRRTGSRRSRPAARPGAAHPSGGCPPRRADGRGRTQASLTTSLVARLSEPSTTTSYWSRRSRAFSRSTRSACGTTRTSGFSSSSRPWADVTLGRSRALVPWRIWRWRFDRSTRSESTEAQRADAGRRQVERRGRAQPASADHHHSRLAEARLPRALDLRHDHLPAVAADLRLGKGDAEAHGRPAFGQAATDRPRSPKRSRPRRRP